MLSKNHRKLKFALLIVSTFFRNESLSQKVEIEVTSGTVQDVYGDRNLVLVDRGLAEGYDLYDLNGLTPFYSSKNSFIKLMSDTTLIEFQDNRYALKTLKGDTIDQKKAPFSLKSVRGNSNLTALIYPKNQGLSYIKKPHVLVVYNTASGEKFEFDLNKYVRELSSGYIRYSGFSTIHSDLKSTYLGLSTGTEAIGCVIFDSKENKIFYESDKHKLLGISPSAEYAYFSNKKGEIFKMSFSDSEIKKIFKTGYSGYLVSPLRFDEDGNFILCNDDGDGYFFENGTLSKSESLPYSFLSSNGKYYISLTEGNSKIFDLTTRKLVRNFVFPSKPDSDFRIVNGFAYGQKGTANGDQNELVRIDMKTGNITSIIEGVKLKKNETTPSYAQNAYTIPLDKSIISRNGSIAIWRNRIQNNETGSQEYLGLSNLRVYHISHNSGKILRQPVGIGDLSLINGFQRKFLTLYTEYEEFLNFNKRITEEKNYKERDKIQREFNEKYPYKHPLKESHQDFYEGIKNGLTNEYSEVIFEDYSDDDRWSKIASLNFEGNILAIPGYPTMLYKLENANLQILDSINFFSTSVEFVGSKKLRLKVEVTDKLRNQYPSIVANESIYNVDQKRFTSFEAAKKEEPEDLDFIVFDDKSFLISDPITNQYLISKGAYDKVFFRFGNKTYDFKSFDLFLNRPDIILEKGKQASDEVINAYKSAYIKRLRKNGYNDKEIQNLLYNKQGFFREDIPEVIFETGKQRIIETDKDNFQLGYYASHPAKRMISSINVIVDGVPLYGQGGKKLEPNQGVSGTLDIPLRAGANKIEIYLTDEDNVNSKTSIFKVSSTIKPVLPTLHIITVGISDYKYINDLTYADKDATEISSLFGSSALFGNIKKYVLTNEKATKNQLLQLKKELEKSSVNDMLILSFAGHGVISEDLVWNFALHG
ncbi:MAG: hypothetical protein AAF620_17165, partial [Bacteroidota bacterium]